MVTTTVQSKFNEMHHHVLTKAGAMQDEVEWQPEQRYISAFVTIPNTA